MKPCLALFSFLLVACGAEPKQDSKGQVDESEPPAIPTAHGKSDDAAKTVAVNVHSAHPYTNNLDKTYAVPLNLPACAKRARLHFKVLRTEANYDFVTVAGEDYSGDRDNTWTEWFTKTGNTAAVRLESDGSITRHGFEIDKVEWDGLPDSCAQVQFPPCAAGTVNIAKRPGTCECPVAPVCEPIANVIVTHHVWRGFDNTTKRVTGANATFTHPGPVEQPVTENIGTVDTVRLAALVRRAAESGLLHGAGYEKPVAGGAYHDIFRIKAGAHDITFAAGQGSHAAAVQALINDFEALFTCDGTGGLTCGNGFTCEEGTCVVEQSCVCSAQYDPVCGVNGQTYSNACQAGCANAPVAHAGECGIPGDFCGGMQGAACADDNRCRYGASTWTAPHPDASGTCVAATYCDAPADCNGLPHIAVPGAWACNANTCAWEAGVAWKAVTNGHFETTNPYANGQSVWHQLYLPAEAQALRLVATRFRLETSYDKLEVWTWKSGAWTKVRTFTGSVGPAATDELTGQYHYLRFVSDSSVTDQGVALDAQWR